MYERPKNFFLGVFPAFVLLVLIPFTIYIPHQDYFDYDIGTTAVFVLAFLLWCGLLAVIASSHRFQESRLFVYLFYVGVFCVLKDIACPVASGGVFGLDRTIPIYEPSLYRKIEVLFFAITLLAAIFTPRKLAKDFLVPMIIAFFAIQAGYIIIKVDWSAHPAESDNKKIVRETDLAGAVKPTKGNVYLICLDSFVGKLFLQSIEEANLETDFSGFTVFPNNLANYTHTNLSVASVMSSTLYSGGSMREFEGLVKNSSIIEGFADAGYTIWQYVSNRDWISDRTTHVRTPPKMKSDALKWPTPIEGIWLLRVAPTALKENVWTWAANKKYETLIVHRTTAALNFLWTLTTDEKDRKPTGQFVHAHFYVPHFPFVFNKDCKKVHPRADFLGQSACSLKPIAALVDQLKADEKFDEATIVIFADHGEIAPGTEDIKSDMDEETKEQVNRVILRGGARALEIRSNALLLIKPPRPPLQPLQVSYRQTQNLDIAATLAHLTGTTISYVDGLSVFSRTFPRDRTINVFTGYIQKDQRQRWFTIGQSIFEGEINHFQYSPVSGWRVLPNIPFEW